MAAVAAPSIAQLLPGGKAALTLTVLDGSGRPVTDEDAGAWRAALVEALAHDDVAIVAPGEPAAPLVVEIRRVEGPGRTDAGTAYRTVRYDAVLRVHRSEVEVRGAPFVAPDAPPRDLARAELIRRIVPVVAY